MRIVPPARPTLYRGVQMRSRLEATVAEWLDAHGFKWDYEATPYAGPGGQYLPDFRLPNVLIEGIPQTLFLEVKPPGAHIGQVLGDMETIWHSEPNARLAVASELNDPYTLPLRWQQDDSRVLANGIWVACGRCHWVGIEDYYHWDRMFWLAHEPWWCPACGHRGFDPISPWVSRQYHRYQGLFGDAEGP